MKTLNEIIKSDNLQTLSFVFFNLGNKVTKKQAPDKYTIAIQYRVSKFSSMVFSDAIAQQNNELLRKYTNLPFEIVTSTENTIKHEIKLIDDSTLSRNDFLFTLYSRIEQTRFSYTNQEFESVIMSSFFIPRGSIDLTRNYFTVDVLKQNVSEQYISSLLSLLMSLKDIKQLNFNFRELQPEYLKGKNRNTQLRVNLRWFYDQYLQQVKELNVYKYDLLHSNRDEIMLHTYNQNLAASFIERAVFYKDQILGKQDDFEKLSRKQINKIVREYRDELDFDDDAPKTDKVSRDSSIVKLAIISQPDICHSCNDKYPLEERTFTMRGSKRPYLEIHHVVSFGADNSGDVLENLVKLCPACHRALTPNRAEAEYQKEIIGNILSNSTDAHNYVKLFIKDKESTSDAIDFVYHHLM